MFVRAGWVFLAAALMAFQEQPDNTKRNQRDRRDGAITAGQQGESQADRAMTQKIRKGITGADGMSTYARNVKVITREGKVTLRGPVKSEDEKRKIESIAKTAAGESNVVSELEVKGETK